MIDHKKRRTLKIMSGTLAAGTTLLSTNSLASTAEDTCGTYVSDDKASIDPHTFMIDIITGRTAQEDTVIFRNQSAKDIVIAKFLPGVVTLNDQMLDLNTLLNNGDIHLKPDYPVASTAANWRPLSLEPSSSYLWCDSAVTKLRGSETGIISLHAVVNNGRAMLTAVHEDTIFS